MNGREGADDPCFVVVIGDNIVCDDGAAVLLVHHYDRIDARQHVHQLKGRLGWQIKALFKVFP